MIRKLQRKFLLAAIAAVFLVLLLLIGAINVLNFASLVSEADGTLEILSSNGGSFPQQMFRPQDRPVTGEALSEEPPALPEEGRAFFDLRRGGMGELAYQARYFTVRFDGAGNLLRSDLEHIATLSEEEASALAEAVYARGQSRGFRGDYRYCRTESQDEILLVFLNCQRELASFRTFLYASVGISLAGILAVFLLLLLFSGRIVRPIAESYEKQKRFITDAGHELKTPITIIRADTDVLEGDLAEDNEWLADIRRQTHRLTELTADLIYLSRMEEEDPALQQLAFSLSELVEETARSFQALALAQDKRFQSSVADGLTVTGDEKAMAKLVSILMDNAMKYSPAGGSVTLTLLRAGRNARLTVKNSTLPMEKGSADHLLERFTRGDSSRSSESGGFGLGLSIARAVAEAHRGSIHAQSEDGESLTVTVELPLSGPHFPSAPS